MAKKRMPRKHKKELAKKDEGAQELSAVTTDSSDDEVTLPTELSELVTDADVQRILLYGPPKIGKSTLASKFPKALILDADNGYRWLKVKKVKVTKWEHILSVGYQLADANENQREHGFKTLVLDSTETIYKLCVKYICEREGVKDLAEMQWGEGYHLMDTEFENVIRAFDSLGLGVVFISNSEFKQITDRFGKEVTIEQPKLPKRAEQLITPLCDLLLKVEVDRTNKDEDGDFTERVLLPQSNPFMTTGGRMSHLLPRKINATYQDLHKALKDAAVRISKETN